MTMADVAAQVGILEWLEERLNGSRVPFSNFLSDTDRAWCIVGQMQRLGYRFILVSPESGAWRARFVHRDEPSFIREQEPQSPEVNSAPAAICLAAKAALEAEEGEGA